MDASVRTALQNLQGLFDEGWIRKDEYDKRRKKILDQATAVAPEGTEVDKSVPTTSVFDRLGGTACEHRKMSVFDRLGSNSGSGSRLQIDEVPFWDHGGYEAMYGKQRPRPVTVVRKSNETAIGGPRPKPIGIQKKAGQGRAEGQKDKQRRRLPAKCPW